MSVGDSVEGGGDLWVVERPGASAFGLELRWSTWGTPSGSRAGCVAFLVAACLSVVAVVGSLFVRTPETGSAPARH